VALLQPNYSHSGVIPIPLVIAAVVGLVALIIYHWDEIKAVTVQVWNALVGWLSQAWESIKSTLSSQAGADRSLGRNQEHGFGHLGGHQGFFVQYWDERLVVFTGPIGLLVKLIVDNWDAIQSKTQEIWNAVT
jgi:hypothetical protein